MKKKKTAKRTTGKITSRMTVNEVMKKYPKTNFVFMDYGFHCVGCPMAEPETIKEAAMIHRVDLKRFLNDLNKAAKK